MTFFEKNHPVPTSNFLRPENYNSAAVVGSNNNIYLINQCFNYEGEGQIYSQREINRGGSQA